MESLAEGSWGHCVQEEVVSGWADPASARSSAAPGDHVNATMGRRRLKYEEARKLWVALTAVFNYVPLHSLKSFSVVGEVGSMA